MEVRHLDKDKILKIKLINLHLNQNIVDDFTHPPPPKSAQFVMNEL